MNTTLKNTVRQAVTFTAVALLVLAVIAATSKAEELTRVALRPEALAYPVPQQNNYAPITNTPANTNFNRYNSYNPAPPDNRWGEGGVNDPLSRIGNYRSRLQPSPPVDYRGNYQGLSNPYSQPAPGHNVPVNYSVPTRTPAIPNYEERLKLTPIAPPTQVRDENEIDTKITYRYQDPKMVDFLSRTNMNQSTSLYIEASKLIDSRHVSPLSYEERTRRALTNLRTAVGNSAFLRASGANPSPSAIQNVQANLDQLMQSNPARSSNEAIGMMQWAAQLANSQLGVRQEAVALEFLNGSIDSLDKYSAFMPSRSGTAALEADWQTATIDGRRTAGLEENIVGIGIELKADEQGALVVGTVEGGPAERARLTAGDVIVGVNGQRVSGMSLNQIADMISGPLGSGVSFNILRNNQTYDVSLRRESIYISSVSGAKMLDMQTGYVRLKQFSASSRTDLEKALLGMYRQGMKSIVLDLRGNPGGLLTQAIEVSDLFVPCGRIVATKGRTAGDDSDERAKWEKTWSLPLVVLVDGNSASASEIFAAAIQENGRGVIVGRTTYGKGSVQTHFPLQSVSGNLKLTTAKFYSPAGREMAEVGVTPDIPVTQVATGAVGAAIESDVDVQMALRTIADGTADRLAQESSKCQTRYDLNRIGN